MTQKLNRRQFGTRTLLLAPLFVLLFLVHVNRQFKNDASSTSSGFSTLQIGMRGQDSVHSQLAKWLKQKGYVRCKRPKFGVHYLDHREEWFCCIKNKDKHYVSIRSNDFFIGADVSYESRQWIFQPRNKQDALAQEVVAELREWWSENSTLLKTEGPDTSGESTINR